jgi:hypothetical protein
MITKNITITATIAAALVMGHFMQRCSRNDEDDDDNNNTSARYSGSGGGSAHGVSGTDSASSKQGSVSRGGFGRSGWGFGGGS